MKIFIKSIFGMLLLFSTLVIATGVDESTIITDDKINNELLNIDDAVDIVNLSATSTNGLSVCNFRIKTLPDEESGTLYMADGETAVKINQNLTEEESNGLMFDPKDEFVGNANFTYSGIDIDGKEGTIATVTLPIIANTLEDSNNFNETGDTNVTYESNDTSTPETEVTLVVTDDKLNPNMLNTLPAVDILNLSGKDANGVAVDNFIIKSLVIEDAGTLYMPDAITIVTVDQNLTKDEADGLKFDPNEIFVGDANFTYQAVDVNGNLGNIATVTIPIIGASSPDRNGSKKGCTCNDYTESLPIFSSFGIFLMMILTSLFGLFFMRKDR